MKPSFHNQIDAVKMLMEARADPFLRDREVRSISSFFISFHVCRVKQQVIMQEKGVILILKDCWRNMREILKDWKVWDEFGEYLWK